MIRTITILEGIFVIVRATWTPVVVRRVGHLLLCVLLRLLIDGVCRSALIYRAPNEGWIDGQSGRGVGVL